MRTEPTPLAAAASAAPDAPGVYYLLAQDMELLYVGKAGSIRKRLAQHAKAKASAGGRRLDILYSQVTTVRLEVLADESAALVREADVIVALQPRFNASYSLDGKWTYIVVEQSPAVPIVRLGLTHTPPPEVRVYGCFPHLGPGVSSAPGIACTDGYAALLRLLWAASPAENHMPARITRESAPRELDVEIDSSLQPALHAFLAGTSSRLLTSLGMLVQQRHAYMQPGLARDRELASAFFDAGPRALRARRVRHGLGAGPLSPETMRTLVAAEVRAAIGEFVLPPQPHERDRFLGTRAHRWARER